MDNNDVNAVLNAMRPTQSPPRGVRNSWTLRCVTTFLSKCRPAGLDIFREIFYQSAPKNQPQTDPESGLVW